MKFIARATVFFNGDFYEFAIIDQGMIALGSLDIDSRILQPDATDVSLGLTLRESLKGSKQIPFDEFQKILKTQAIKTRDAERISSLVKQFGYKSKTALYKNMRCCWVSVKDEEIEIAPSHHKSMDSFTSTKDAGPFPFSVSEKVSDAELGAAIREGFNRCTG